MKYLKEKDTRLSSFKLVKVLEYYGIKTKGLHNSYDDTKALAELIRRVGCPF